MIDPISHPPRWLPLRLIVLSALATCALLSWQAVPSSEWLRLLVGLTPIAEGGTTLATAMLTRCTITLCLILGAALVAQTLSLAVSMIVLRLGWPIQWLVGFLGRFLSLFPIIAVSWLAVGWIVGAEGQAIESLVPHYPTADRDTFALSLGRILWWWLLPIWLLAIPLFGSLIGVNVKLLANVQDRDLADGLRARGIRPASVLYGHWLRSVWPDMLSWLQSSGIALFGYALFVEEVLGIQGWGTFLAGAVKTASVSNIAGAIYACGWMAAGWCLCISLIRRLTVGSQEVPLTTPALPDPTAPRSFGTLLGCLLLFLSTGFIGGDASEELSRLVGPLVTDLGIVACASGLALIIALTVCCFLRILDAGRVRLPRTDVISTLSWSPLLVYLIGLSALGRFDSKAWILLGIASGITGAVLLRTKSMELASRPHVEAALAMGASPFLVWRTHSLPDFALSVLSWVLRSASVTLVWLTLLSSLAARDPAAKPTSMGQLIADASHNILADRTPLLIPALVVGIFALSFSQLGRIVHPTPPPQ